MRTTTQKILSAFSVVGIALLMQTIALGATLPADPARWNLWLDITSATDAVTPILVLPASKPPTPDPAWLERWGRQSPAIAWNDTVIDLIVKYQQNPLRATRAMALLHAAMHDALALCARERCGGVATRIALHAAAGRTLRHLYPQESPGRFEALALSAAYATVTAHSPDGNIQNGWRLGYAAARAAITRALDDGADLPRDLLARPNPRPGLWRAAPPMNIHDPAEPRAGEEETQPTSSSARVKPIGQGSEFAPQNTQCCKDSREANEAQPQ